MEIVSAIIFNVQLTITRIKNVFKIEAQGIIL